MGYRFQSNNTKSRPARAGFSHSSRSRSPRPKSVSTIDPRRFVAAAAPSTQEETPPTHSFADFKLHPLIHTNLSKKGYVDPSPIQDQTIPIALEGHDVIGLAGTGTGKTAAFALPILNALLNSPAKTAIIIAPTRELAQQIDTEIKSLTVGSRLKTTIIIGGASMGMQLRELSRNPQIIIGTPGRLKDHMQRKTIKLHNCSFVVLDEVDRMLDMGFVNDVRSILGTIQTPHQSFFFSATMNEKIRDLIETFAHSPKTVAIQTSRPSENVHQDVVAYRDDSDRLSKLHDLLISESVHKTIVFEETQRRVEKLHKELQTRGFKSEAMHGGKTQGQRQRALSKFRNDEIDILVATDVAARGIDVANISHVINYSAPKEYDDYIHRIGRAGRAGKIGYAYTFVTERPTNVSTYVQR